jgi:hypothetical protein
MAANARLVINDTNVAWDGGLVHVPAGTIVDIPPGSVLETAYGGTGNLADLDDEQAQAAADGTGVTN